MTLLKLFHRFLPIRRYSSFQKEAIDWDYFSDPSNFVNITSNVMLRSVNCQLKSLLTQLQELSNSKDDPVKCEELKERLAPLLFWLPNETHPRVRENKSGEAAVIEKVGSKTQFAYFPTNFESLTKRLNVLRTKNLGHICGNKSYFLKSDLASLEQALVRFSLDKLRKRNFEMVSVPDILSASDIEKCGMRTENKHSQVYHVHGDWSPDVCLSGTSELALASLLSGRVFSASDLPLRLCSVSRCFRAEAKRGMREKGLFRVHHFTKVEMFGVTAAESGRESEELLSEFSSVQREIFSELGLHFRVLEMPPGDLGLPAHRKIDTEAWIPTQKIYGEVSSASNCTDYQSRRLGIRYTPDTNGTPDESRSDVESESRSSGGTKFCHTVNGTASAIPRLLIAIFENNQNLDGSVDVPKPLQKYMRKEVISDKFREVMLCTKPVK